MHKQFQNYPSILHVEDDDVDAMALERALLKQGIGNPLVRAHDGLEAMGILRWHRIDRPYLILLDLNLPRMNGLEVLKALRQDPELSDSVVFVITTSNTKDDILGAYREHAAGYVSKQSLKNGYIDMVKMLEHYWNTVKLPLDEYLRPFSSVTQLHSMTEQEEDVLEDTVAKTDDTAEAMAGQENSHTEGKTEESRLRILIIDDDALDRMAVIRALSNSNKPIEVIEASSAADGFEKFSQSSFDAILLDYRLPDQDGLSLLQDIVKCKTGSTAVIMLSGVENETLEMSCLQAGAQDFLLKQDLQPHHLRRCLLHSKQRHDIEVQLRDSHERLRSLAEEDVLTGLPNRHFFEQSLRRALAHAGRNDLALTLLLIDLDNFKNVNDSHGHDIGDLLLKEVATRFSLAIRESDILCRLGGDEFVVLAHQESKEDTIDVLGNRLCESLNEPIRIDDLALTVTASIGIASYPEDAGEGSELLKCADLSLYGSKDSGKNRLTFYSRDLQENLVRRLKLQDELRQAIKQQEFEVFYQPQINSKSGRIDGVEALIRWRHPTRGLLSPDQFITELENSGLIFQVGDWVLNSACRQWSEWRQQGLAENIVLAVNLSARQLQKSDLTTLIEKALHDTLMPPENLELEITESMLIDDIQHSAFLLENIVSIGVKISLDDFGTGYSSPAYLKVLPISRLKVDKSFLMQIPTNEKDCRLLKSIILLAQSMDLKTTIEGIETKTQADLCIEYGADILQGYYYARPLHVSEMTHLLLSGHH